MAEIEKGEIDHKAGLMGSSTNPADQPAQPAPPPAAPAVPAPGSSPAAPPPAVPTQGTTTAAGSSPAVVLAQHTMKSDETLSDLSLKYYGHATEPYWRVIYNANKDAIGDNPNHVRPGTVLKIPTLPDELKKK